MRIRHLIWDWNGTLFDDLALSISVMNELLSERNLPLLDCDRYHTHFGFPVIRYYERIGFDFSRESFEVAGAEFIRRYDEQKWAYHIFSDILPTLKRAHEMDITCSVLSASPHDELEKLIRHYGLAPYMSHVAGLDNIYAHSKVEKGLHHIQELRIPPESILMIGDTTHDHEVAEAMGTRTLLVARGHQHKSTLQQTGQPVIDQLDALWPVLN